MNHNNNFELSREQYELLYQIQNMKLRKVWLPTVDLGNQIRRLEDQQNQMEITNDFLTEIQQRGNRQRQNIDTIFSNMCGSEIWPNLACCVAETVNGRQEETKMMANRYKVMIDQMKKKLETWPDACIKKALQTKVGELMTGVEDYDVEIGQEKCQSDQLEIENQQRIQTERKTILQLETRLIAKRQELEQLEGVDQSQDKAVNQIDATSATTSSAIGTAVPRPIMEHSDYSNNGQQIYNDDDLTLSPIKIDEPVELLSCQLSESSIHEKNPYVANERVINEEASALPNLIQHPNVHNDDERNRQHNFMRAAKNDVFVKPTTPKRFLTKIRNPPAKKPCSGESVSVQTDSRSDSSFRKHHRNIEHDVHFRLNSSVNSLAQKPAALDQFPKMPETAASQPSNATMKLAQKQSTPKDFKGQKHETEGDSMAMFGSRQCTNIIQSKRSEFEFGGPSKTSNLSDGLNELKNSETAPDTGNGNDSEKSEKSGNTIGDSFGEGLGSIFNNDDAAASNFGYTTPDDSSDSFELAVSRTNRNNRASVLKHYSTFTNIVPNASGQNIGVTNQSCSEQSSFRKAVTATFDTEQETKMSEQSFVVNCADFENNSDFFNNDNDADAANFVQQSDYDAFNDTDFGENFN